MTTKQVLDQLRAYESRNVTFIEPDGSWPIVWERAKGVNVWDADGKKYLDLTAAFGVAAAGHANPRVVKAGQKQMAKLLHAMGDIHPHALKAELARELSRITFERWSAKNKVTARQEFRLTGKTIFCNSGFEAVEAAIKTAMLATGKRGIIAFTGAYHGLGYGALSVTHRDQFRAPFRSQLGKFGHFVPFPVNPVAADARRTPRLFSGHLAHVATERGQPCPQISESVMESRGQGYPRSGDLDRLISANPSEPPYAGCYEVDAIIRRLFRKKRIGAVLVEPIQGRGGINIPPPEFLPLLRRLCNEHKALLILDEIYTGFGRTGKWFACEHTGTVPDLICLGKALTGGFPLSACVGRADLMDAAWPESTGEAVHTSTFLGHPVGCAMALAQIKEIRSRKLVEHSAKLGNFLLESLKSLNPQPSTLNLSVRGLGLMAGVELRLHEGSPATTAALQAIKAMLNRGYVLLPEGGHSNVISFTPPLTISKQPLKAIVSALAEVLTTNKH
jgi:4-aminobutyrate aminotransferase-like enzyme